jgi:microcystin-dependent protein
MKLILAALLSLTGPAFAGVWDTTTPLNTDPISQGDDRIRELKVAIQEALRGGDTEGVEAIFPGGSAATAPIFRYRGLKGATGSRPAATYGGLYYNTTTGTLQRSSYTATDTGAGWEDITENAAYEAIHYKAPAALASVAGVATIPETGNSFNVSGTEAITSIAGWSAGLVRIKWDSARIITHGASLVLKNALSRNVVAGDISVFEFTAADAVREVGFYGAGDGSSIGEIKTFAGATVPAGFLECAGQSLLRADYPGLYAVIGTVHGTADGTHFNLPDLRGRFVRGYDHGAGNDPDAVTRSTQATGGASGDNVGTLQDSSNKQHSHTLPFSAVGVANTGGATTEIIQGTSAYNTGDSPADAIAESRPKNVTMMYVIKY